jgi:hypothetical protein
MKKPTPEFMLDELLAELTPDDSIDGFTVRDLCEQAKLEPTSTNMRKVKRRVDDRVARGEWEPVGKVIRVSPTGINWPTQAYRPKERG